LLLNRARLRWTEQALNGLSLQASEDGLACKKQQLAGLLLGETSTGLGCSLNGLKMLEWAGVVAAESWAKLRWRSLARRETRARSSFGWGTHADEWQQAAGLRSTKGFREWRR